MLPPADRRRRVERSDPPDELGPVLSRAVQQRAGEHDPFAAPVVFAGAAPRRAVVAAHTGRLQSAPGLVEARDGQAPGPRLQRALRLHEASQKDAVDALVELLKGASGLPLYVWGNRIEIEDDETSEASSESDDEERTATSSDVTRSELGEQTGGLDSADSEQHDQAADLPDFGQTLEQNTATPRNLAEALRIVIEDPTHHAQIWPRFSQAPMLGTWGKVQSLYVDNLRAVEAGAHGAGVTIAIHEIWENYTSWKKAVDGQQSKYGVAHSSAVDVENIVSEQLFGVGKRVATAAGGLTDPSYFDYETYYLVLQPVVATNAPRMTARRVARRPVATLTVEDFDAGSAKLSPSADQLVRHAAIEHLQGKAATARISGSRGADEPTGVSKERADAVWVVMMKAAGERRRLKDPGATRGSVRGWSHDAGEGQAAVTIKIEAPDMT